MRARLPSIEAIGQNAPPRLGVAAALAFPDGTMTASGLRREAARNSQCGGRPIVAAESHGKTSGHSRGVMAHAFGVP
jgi:hypothetical protein